MARTTAPKKDPHALAVAAADEYFEALTQHYDISDAYENPGDSPIETAIEEIEQLLGVDKIAKDAKDDPIALADAEMDYRMISRKAAFVVGVQVGLRLRSSGGSR